MYIYYIQYIVHNIILLLYYIHTHTYPLRVRRCFLVNIKETQLFRELLDFLIYTPVWYWCWLSERSENIMGSRGKISWKIICNRWLREAGMSEDVLDILRLFLIFFKMFILGECRYCRQNTLGEQYIWNALE